MIISTKMHQGINWCLCILRCLVHKMNIILAFTMIWTKLHQGQFHFMDWLRDAIITLWCPDFHKKLIEQYLLVIQWLLLRCRQLDIKAAQTLIIHISYRQSSKLSKKALWYFYYMRCPFPNISYSFGPSTTFWVIIHCNGIGGETRFMNGYCTEHKHCNCILMK